MTDQADVPVNTTVVLTIRPGDALVVMPLPGEVWSEALMDRMRALIEWRLPENRIIVLPYTATFATVAMEEHT
jgi:hypothetical protein